MVHRLVVLEDLTVVREMLVEVLGADPRYRVVGAFADGASGEAEIRRLAPEVALVDYMLPGKNGLDLSRRIMPSVKVVLLTAHERPEVLCEAVEAGVHAVVSKAAPLQTVKDAVAQVLAGRAYYCPATAAALREMRVAPRDPLSAREREIVSLVALGLTNKEIAIRLGISEKTVANHRTNLMRKLGVHDVATLTRYALERGLTPSSG